MRAILQSPVAWGVARDIRTKIWHGAANVATAGSFFLNCIFKWKLCKSVDSFTSKRHLFLYQTSCQCQELSFLLNKLPSCCSNVPTGRVAAIYKNANRPTRKSPCFSVKSWHKSPHFLILSFWSSLCYSHNKNYWDSQNKSPNRCLSKQVLIYHPDYSQQQRYMSGTQSWRQSWTPDYRMLSIGQSGSAGSWWNNLYLPALLSPLWSCSAWSFLFTDGELCITNEA